jgi:RNA polymerase sigma-70 factor (ECF subfamily)
MIIDYPSSSVPSPPWRRLTGPEADPARAGEPAPILVAIALVRSEDCDAMLARENAALLRRVAAGDAAAFERLYDQLAPRMFSLAMRMVGSRADAEDVLQIGFAQVWRNAKDYRVDLGSAFTWIATIVRRKAIDRLRARQGHWQRIDAAFNARGAGWENWAGDVQLIACERETAVRTALGKLIPTERSAIQLAFFDGLTHGEIALSQSAPVGTVKARIRRGMQKLRRALIRPSTGCSVE